MMLEKIIKEDLRLNNIFETLVFNRAKWCRVIHIADLIKWDNALALSVCQFKTSSAWLGLLRFPSSPTSVGIM